MVGRLLAYGILLTALARAGSTAAYGAEASYQIVGTHAAPGQRGVVVSIQASFPEQTQGFSMALRHDCSACVLQGTSVDGTVAHTADFVEALEDPQAPGAIVIGLLMCANPPMGTMIPRLDTPETVIKLIFDIAPGAKHRDYAFSFVPEGLPSGNAWIQNVYAAFNESHPVPILREGKFTIGREPQGGYPVFIRGDANQDRVIDLADPIHVVDILFKGAAPRCLDACDANDSGYVNIGDAVFLLYFLFRDGTVPYEPFILAGPDWTDDAVGCEDPVRGWTTDI